MENSLERWRRELATPLPHPDATELRRIGLEAFDFLLDHFATLPEQSIGRTLSRRDMEAALKEPVPETGRGFSRVLDEFREKVWPFSFRVNHPRFWAFIPSAPNYVSVVGDWLCAWLNFFAGVWLEASGPTEVELVVLDWFRDLLGLPTGAGGILTGGGSEANLTALVTAREGLAFDDRPRAVLYLSEQRHHSLDRAAKVMGLAPEQIRLVASRDRYRLDPASLEETVTRDLRQGRLPWLLAANAGATNTGAVDPLDELAEVCCRHRLWFHVDAAYGWPAVLTAEGRQTLAGIHRADSVTLDPHKWFAQPFEAGCLLVRDARHLTRAFAMLADYMQDVQPGEEEVNFADCGIALTRRFRALKIWLSVKVLGLSWFRALVERCCRLADFAQGLLEESGSFEILCPRQLSIVCFRYRPSNWSGDLDSFNLALAEELRKTGQAFISSTRLDGRVALRFCFINWRTTSADVERGVGLLSELGARLAARR